VIVVDTNLIAYCWLQGPQTEAAQAVRAKDPDWHVPILWRSELRSVLAGYMRHGAFGLRDAKHVMSTVETEFADAEHEIDSGQVLELAQQSKLSAYDCEYVVLARALGAALISADKAVLRAAPDVAMSMQDYLRVG
jgi:predicted nucleic acid-binding protein